MTISRRKFLGTSGAAVAGLVASKTLSAQGQAVAQTPRGRLEHSDHGGSGMVGTVDPTKHNGFSPTEILTDFDFGETRTLEDGRTERSWTLTAIDKLIEIAPGVTFPAWTYNGRVPGPTLRCNEGEALRIEFINGGTHPHTIHFHGIHNAKMDGVPGVGAGVINPGGRTSYTFDAFPFGCHLYHCHSTPLKRHIHKGLYGAFIIDPDPARHPEEADAAARRTAQGARDRGIQELVMVMNSFDTTFDDENEVYAVNTVAFAYMQEPIVIKRDQDVRVYLVNITEFDPINSFHLHANFFDYYDHGTTLTPTLKTVDTIMQCQAQRGILEFNFRGFETGQYMFHPHQTEFVELGWMGFFEVVE